MVDVGKDEGSYRLNGWSRPAFGRLAGGNACVVPLPLLTSRILVQFLAQILALRYMRKHRPEIARPFRMWLYPLPPIVALVGFAYVVFVRRGSATGLMIAGAVVLVGTLVFVLRGYRPLSPP